MARLLTVKAAAAYCGLSYWTLRDYLRQGLIPTVALPPLQTRPGAAPRTSLRRVLVDVRDLDAFVERCKARDAGDQESPRPTEPPENTRRTDHPVPRVYPRKAVR